MSIERAKGGHRVRWREGGRQRSKLIPGAKKHAETFEAETKRRLIMGDGSDWWTQGTQPFEQFAREWFDRKVPELSRRTAVDYGILIDRFLVPSFGDTPLRAINVALIENFRDDALSKRTGKRQLQLALGLLSQILDRAQARGEIQTNPAKLIRGPKQDPRQSVKPLAPEMVEAIRDWLLRNRTHRDATLVSVLAYAGLRPGEALALHWHHVQGSKLRVEGAVALGTLGPTKTGHTRSVDLLPSLRQDLAEFNLAQGRPSGLIFRGIQKDLWTQTMWQNWWRQTWLPAVTTERKPGDETPKGVGIVPRPRPYDLRHSWVSLRIAEGWNYIEVAAQAGHDPRVTLGTYGHMFQDFEPGERVSAEERIRAAREKRRAAV